MVARYREIADDLQRRIVEGEFNPGNQLPSIAALQKHYEVPAPNTIRDAQQLLVANGLIETHQGRGAFVLRNRPEPKPVDVVAELKLAHAALGRAIAGLEQAAVTPARTS